MPEITRALIVLAVLTLFVLLPNIIIVKSNRVHVIERLGKYHRSLDQKGVYMMIPLIDRVIQVVKTDVQENHLLMKSDDSTSHVTYRFQVTDVMKYVYRTLDVQKDIEGFIKALLNGKKICEDDDFQTIEHFMKEHGVDLFEIKIDNC